MDGERPDDTRVEDGDHAACDDVQKFLAKFFFFHFHTLFVPGRARNLSYLITPPKKMQRFDEAVLQKDPASFSKRDRSLLFVQGREIFGEGHARFSVIIKELRAGNADGGRLGDVGSDGLARYGPDPYEDAGKPAVAG